MSCKSDKNCEIFPASDNIDDDKSSQVPIRIIPSNLSINNANLCFVLLVSNLGSFLFGYDFGAVSWVITGIKRETLENSSESSFCSYISNHEIFLGLIASGASIGSLLLYLILLFYGNNLPKREEIQLSALFFFTGCLMEGVSGFISFDHWGGLTSLMIGRFLFGFGVALSFHSVPQYISELSPKAVRGVVGSTTEAMVVIGIFTGYVIGEIFDGTDEWTQSFFVGNIVAIVMGFFALFIPQSILWLLKSNACDEDILITLQYIYPSANHDDVMMTRVEYQKEVDEVASNSIRNRLLYGSTTWFCSCTIPDQLEILLSGPVLRKCLALTIVLVILQMFTGQMAILYFAGEILDSVIPDYPNAAIAGLGTVKLMSALTMTVVADMYGRRTFLIFGTFLMFWGLLVLSLGIQITSPAVSLTGMYSATVGYEIGFGSMLWILLSELFPRYVRSTANSCAVSVLFASAMVVTLLLPVVSASIGKASLFLIFSMVSLIAVFVIYAFVPETRGLDLETAYKQMSSRSDHSCDESTPFVKQNNSAALP